MRKGEREVREMMEGGKVEWLRLGGRVEFMEPTKRPQARHVAGTYVETAQSEIRVVLGV